MFTEWPVDARVTGMISETSVEMPGLIACLHLDAGCSALKSGARRRGRMKPHVRLVHGRATGIRQWGSRRTRRDVYVSGLLDNYRPWVACAACARVALFNRLFTERGDPATVC